MEFRTIDTERQQLLSGVARAKANKDLLHDIEQHFFKKGYQYALLHFDCAAKELKIDSELEKKILDEYLNFLEPMKEEQ